MRDYYKEALELETFLVTNEIDDTHTLKEMMEAYVIKLNTPKNPFEGIFQETEIEKTDEPAPRKLSKDQEIAWDKIKEWSRNDKPYFVLRGFAGTGKSFLMQMMSELRRDVYYSATTNKAAKVLGKSIGTVARTTYSILGLRMEQHEDKLVLTPKPNPPYFPRGSILVIDEGSMVGQVLCDTVEAARKRCSIKILYVGDPAQLPPVGETKSPVWTYTDDPECHAMLKEVMRHDNQVLKLATELRECIKAKNWSTPLRRDHDENGGVWKFNTQEQFKRRILQEIEKRDLHETKVIAWRNKTVDSYNAMIRKHLGFNDPYNVGDIILLAEPYEKAGVLVAHTDDEFSITEICDDTVNIDGAKLDTWRIVAQGDKKFVFQIAKQQNDLDSILSVKARLAKKAKGFARKTAWDDFWKTKAQFQRIRYGYALTAHRAQGSSYETCFVDQYDILCNPNKREAFKCLYVAVSRASKSVFSY